MTARLKQMKKTGKSNKPGTSKPKPGPSDIAVLRKEAEKRLRAQSDRLDELTEKDVRQLAHELGTHQIELEMQNEELRGVRNEIETSRSKYSDLYDFSPVGYFTFDKNGLIYEVNLTGANLLGVERSNLIKRPFQPFIDRGYRSVFHVHCAEVLNKRSLQTCEIGLRKKDGTGFHAQLQSIPVKDRDGNAVYCRTALIDVSERKKSEEIIEHLASFPQLTPNPVIEVDLSGNIVFCNPSTYRILESMGMEKGQADVFLPEDIRLILASSKQQKELTLYREITIKDRVFDETVHFPPRFNVIRIYVLDITERKQAEEALRENRADLNRAQAVGLIGSWRLDVRENVLVWSDETHRIFGIPKGTTLTYETFLSNIHPDDRAYVDTQWKAALRGEPYDIEHRLLVEGRIKWVREKAYIEFDKDGSLIGGFGIAQDITDRKLMEEALRKSLDRYQSYIEVTGQLGWTTSAEGEVKEDMPSWRAYTGQTYDELKGWGWTEALHREDLENTVRVWKKALAEKSTYETEYRIRRHDGVYRHFMARGIPLFESDGSIREWIGTCIDITERKQTEEALLKSNAFNQSIIDSSSDCIKILDLDGRLQFMSPGGQLLLGIRDFGKFLNVPYEQFWKGTDREAVTEVIRKAKQGQSGSFQGFCPTADGTPKWWDVVISPVLGIDGNPERLLAVSRDITERREAAEALGRAKDELEIKVAERTAELGKISSALAHERQRFYDVLETLPVYIVLLTRDYHVRFANRVFRELFGESCGKRCFELLFGRSEPCEICETYTVLKSMAPHEWEWTGPNGRTYSIYDFPFSDVDKSSLILEMGIDITERKQAEASLRKTTELLERVFSTTHVMIAYMDAAFNYVRVNRAYAYANYRDPEFYEGKNHFDLYPDGEDEEIFRRVAKTGEPFFAFERPFEYAERPEWGLTYRDWSLMPLKGADGKVNGLLLSLIDVTDRKRAEEGMTLFRSLVNQTSDAIIVVSPETGRIVDINNAASSMFGYSRDELFEMTAADFVERFREASLWEKLVAELREKGSMLLEEWPRRKDGGLVPVEASLKYIALGKKHYVIADVRDITERREAAEQMRVTNDLLKLFVQKISRKEYLDAVVDLIRSWSGCCCLGIRILDEQGNVPYEAFSGFSREFWNAENMLSIDQDACFCTRAVQGMPQPAEMSAVTRNGSYYFNNAKQFFEGLPDTEKKNFRGACIRNGFMSLAVIPIRYHETVLGALHIADKREGMVPLRKIEFLEMLSFIIGEALFRFGIEDNLRQNYQLLENIFSNIHLQIAYMDRDFNYIRVNRLYAESHGIDKDEADGKNYFDMHPAMEERSAFAKVVDSGEPYFAYADPFVSRDHPGGTTYWDWSIQPVKDEMGTVTGLVLSCLDVTEKITLQADAMRAAHLASLGEMAAGVAHEINNPINGIINYAQILVDGSSADSRQQGISRMIIEEGMRIANIVRSLLSFARDRREGKGPASVQDILTSALSLSEAQLNKDGISLEIEMPEGLPAIFAQPQQILQVFLNVINNARHALNARFSHKHPDKVLRITGKEIVENDGRQIMISFHDQGSGIPSDIIDKVMNPFFTTKPSGMGTGLGLSISHGIIADHGGSLKITSREGEYTDVAVCLPVYRGAEK